MISCTLQYGDTLLIELEFGNVDFLGEVQPGTSKSKDETNRKLNPHDAKPGNQSQATLVGCKCSHHCAI